MECMVCKRNKKIAARGLCSACYSRLRERGTTDYAEKRVRHKCEVDGCESISVAKSLCDLHYRRYMKYGDVNADKRPESWGAVCNHPLTNTYKWFMRNRNIRAVCKEWQDDFLQFIADVGDRPSDRHKLTRVDASLPIGPDNFYWKENTFSRGSSEDKRAAAARYQREYRKMHPQKMKHADLARHYGISLKEYNAMVESQDGKCAICGVDETLEIRGKTVRLAVDHCHTTGKVRGLLCAKCNQGIGCLKDDVELLQSAIDYLRIKQPEITDDELSEFSSRLRESKKGRLGH